MRRMFKSVVPLILPLKIKVTFHIPAYVLPDNGAEPVAAYSTE